MMQQSPYAYVLETGSGSNIAVFTWPNAVKKYIRDTYTVNGTLHLPPSGLIKLTRFKVNPQVGKPVVRDQLHIEAFLAAR